MDGCTVLAGRRVRNDTTVVFQLTLDDGCDFEKASIERGGEWWYPAWQVVALRCWSSVHEHHSLRKMGEVDKKVNVILAGISAASC